MLPSRQLAAAAAPAAPASRSSSGPPWPPWTARWVPACVGSTHRLAYHGPTLAPGRATPCFPPGRTGLKSLNSTTQPLLPLAHGPSPSLHTDSPLPAGLTGHPAAPAGPAEQRAAAADGHQHRPPAHPSKVTGAQPALFTAWQLGCLGDSAAPGLLMCTLWQRMRCCEKSARGPLPSDRSSVAPRLTPPHLTPFCPAAPHPPRRTAALALRAGAAACRARQGSHRA